MLQADPAAPVSSVLGEAAVKANPFLQARHDRWRFAILGGQKMGGQAARHNPRRCRQRHNLRPFSSLATMQAPAASPYFAQAAPQQAQAKASAITGRRSRLTMRRRDRR